MKARVTCIQCPKCNDIIYSRARHDFHYCGCGACAIDGGFDYCRLLYDPELCNDIKPFNKFIMGVSRKNLYDDWNTGKDKYGLIKGN